jgi:hypothetical protein
VEKEGEMAVTEPITPPTEESLRQDALKRLKILGWGIGVLLNAWDVYGRRPISEHEIAREVERLRR